MSEDATHITGARLVRIDERTQNIDALVKDHIRNDDVRFDRMFHYLETQFTGFGKRFDSMEEKMESLWDDKNIRDGAKINQSLTWSVGNSAVTLVMAIIVAWATVKSMR